MMRRHFFLLTLLCILCLSALPAAAQDVTGDLLGRINGLRASVGSAPYTLNGALSAAAQNQAQWMVDTTQIAHTHPDGSGPRTRALNAGYPSTDVSENIYGGTNASVGSAWTFWVNSGIHYAGLVSTRYDQVGVGAASGSWGSTYVLVFGNSGGGGPPAVSASGGGGDAGGGGGNAALSYSIGVDEEGNLLHEVQPGDTLGDIALIYGYTWDDIPTLMSLNSIADVRDLVVGSTFKVPRRGGTYTPTPGGPTITPTPTPAARAATITPYVYATAVTFPTVVRVAPPGATADGLEDAVAPPMTETAAVGAAPLPPGGPTDGTPIAMLPTDLVLLAERASLPGGATTAIHTDAGTRSPSVWVLAALGLQGAIVVGAAVEFVRRLRRKSSVEGLSSVAGEDVPRVEIRRTRR